jgi:very-short-patch-repair endonuclease
VGGLIVSLSTARKLRNNPTEAEKALWKYLRVEQLGAKFRRQHPIGPYVADFVSLKKKLIIEVDGGQHCDSANDQVRTKWLEDKGYSVLRFWNHDVLTNIEGVCQRIVEGLNGTPHPFLPPQGGKGQLEGIH